MEDGRWNYKAAGDYLLGAIRVLVVLLSAVLPLDLQCHVSHHRVVRPTNLWGRPRKLPKNRIRQLGQRPTSTTINQHMNQLPPSPSFITPACLWIDIKKNGTEFQSTRRLILTIFHMGLHCCINYIIYIHIYTYPFIPGGEMIDMNDEVDAILIHAISHTNFSSCQYSCH